MNQTLTESSSRAERIHLQCRSLPFFQWNRLSSSDITDADAAIVSKFAVVV